MMIWVKGNKYIGYFYKFVNWIYRLRFIFWKVTPGNYYFLISEKGPELVSVCTKRGVILKRPKAPIKDQKALNTDVNHGRQ